MSCECIGQYNPPVQTPCPPEVDNCLKLCDIVLLGEDAVGPCGQTGNIDVSDDTQYGHDYSACTGSVTWSIVDFDSTLLVSANITSAGVLTWVTGPGSTAGKYAAVTLKGCCDDLSDYMTVLIGIKDLCNCPECNECDNCDPCTGDCLDGEVEMQVGGSV